jgi:hypothetical protein
MGLTKKDPVPVWSKPHFSIKSGPNGKAMKGASPELAYLKSEKGADLLEDLNILGGEEFLWYMKGAKTTSGPASYMRKLALVPDVDGKNRVIAMGDYWSQTVLFPFHQFFMKKLEEMGKTDLTFGQSIEPFGPSDQDYHSFDLTAATDRLPVWLNTTILEHLWGSKISKSWERVMTGREFTSSFHDSPLRYSVGQPMGLYSSWVMLAITHHAIVRFSAR